MILTLSKFLLLYFISVDAAERLWSGEKSSATASNKKGRKKVSRIYSTSAGGSFQSQSHSQSGAVTSSSIGMKSRKVQMIYPVEILQPLSSSDANMFEGVARRDSLVCLESRGSGTPEEATYLLTLGCLLFLPLPGLHCESIWGSRTVFVHANSSVEFLRVGHLPIVELMNGDPVTADGLDRQRNLMSLNATRWLQIMEENNREVKHIAAEPLHLCARSNGWKRDSIALFQISFRPIFLRERDRLHCLTKILVHIGLMTMASSMWLLPYLVSLVIGTLVYMHGLKYFLAILFSCTFVVLLFPLMLTKRNRYVARLYISYFFTRGQAEETRMVIKQRLPVFQAVFFSSVLVCFGSTGSYLVYSYCGVDREIRNFMMKLTIGISAAWLVFFFCRSFERFCRDWIWLGLSVGLAQLLDVHMNPNCRSEVMAVTIVMTLFGKLILPRIRLLRLKAAITSYAIPQIKGMWKSFRRIDESVATSTATSVLISSSTQSTDPAVPPITEGCQISDGEGSVANSRLETPTSMLSPLAPGSTLAVTGSTQSVKICTAATSSQEIVGCARDEDVFDLNISGEELHTKERRIVTINESVEEEQDPSCSANQVGESFISYDDDYDDDVQGEEDDENAGGIIGNGFGEVIVEEDEEEIEDNFKSDLKGGHAPQSTGGDDVMDMINDLFGDRDDSVDSLKCHPSAPIAQNRGLSGGGFNSIISDSSSLPCRVLVYAELREYLDSVSRETFRDHSDVLSSVFDFYLRNELPFSVSEMAGFALTYCCSRRIVEKEVVLQKMKSIFLSR